jgi:hypothetical protein
MTTAIKLDASVVRAAPVPPTSHNEELALLNSALTRARDFLDGTRERRKLLDTQAAADLRRIQILRREITHIEKAIMKQGDTP